MRSVRRNECADEGPKGKMKRKVTSLLEKVEVFDKLDGGTRIVAVRCRDGLSRSVMCLLKKNIKVSVPSSSKICGINPGEFSLEERERALHLASCFFCIYFNIVLPSMPGSTKQFLSNTDKNITR
jgi:hypothetical protein